MENDKTPSAVTEAGGLLRYITQLEFILLLEIWSEILESTFALSNYLQAKTMDVTMTSNMVQSTLASIKALRTDDAFCRKY